MSMSKEAGRGGFLTATLHLENSGKLIFVIDSGSAATMFDKSLAPKLGRSIDHGTIWHYGTPHEAGVFRAPTLYAGNVPLEHGSDEVGCFDFHDLHIKSIGAQKIMGVLGMDVMAHYCIQLDFSSGKVRFLDGERSDKSAWGAPFPLTDIGDGCFSVRKNLAGIQDPGHATNSEFNSLIDTGCSDDGWLWPYLYERWTNQAALPAAGETRAPNGVLGREIYLDMDLSELDQKEASSEDSHMKLNGMGLHFLSRHLVTLDFPKETMYLKRTSKWALHDEQTDKTLNSVARSAVAYLHKLKKDRRLPGWLGQEEVEGKSVDFHFQLPNAGIFDARKVGYPDVYHYKVTRAFNNAPWKLQRAWRTTPDGKLLEEFAIP